MIYNADCIASHQNLLQPQIDGTRLRHHYLERLLEIERQGTLDREILDSVLLPGCNFKLKRQRAPRAITSDESDQEEPRSKKKHKQAWEPPNDLGPREKWMEQRRYLLDNIADEAHGRSHQAPMGRAEELLKMIEAIGCRRVMQDWSEAVAQEKARIQPLGKDTYAKAVSQLIEMAQIRSFRDKVLLRIGQWMFTMKIIQDVEKIKKTHLKKSSQAEDGAKGHVLKRAFTTFMDDAHPELKGEDFAEQRKAQFSKYRNWWREGQIWVLMHMAFGATILFLVPAGQVTDRGFTVSNQQ